MGMWNDRCCGIVGSMGVGKCLWANDTHGQLLPMELTGCWKAEIFSRPSVSAGMAFC